MLSGSEVKIRLRADDRFCGNFLSLEFGDQPFQFQANFLNLYKLYPIYK